MNSSKLDLAYAVRKDLVSNYIKSRLSKKKKKTLTDNEYLLLYHLLLLDKENELRLLGDDDKICLVNVMTRQIKLLSDNDINEMIEDAFGKMKEKVNLPDKFKSVKKLIVPALRNLQLKIPEEFFSLFKLKEDISTYSLYILDISLDYNEYLETFKNEKIETFLPNWSKILYRMSNYKVFLHFIGSLFDLKSDRTRYLWLYGEGQNGKSTIVRFLNEVFGEMFFANSFEGTKSRFWTSTLVNKRVYVFEDISNFSGINEMIRPLTGSDILDVEKKFKDRQNIKFFAKFIITSNELPTVSYQSADRRRILPIFLEPVSNEEKTENFHLNLLQEKKLFLNYAYYIYNSCSISELDVQQEFNELAEENYLEIVNLLNKYIERDQFAYLTNTDILKLQRLYYDEFGYTNPKFKVRRKIKEALISLFGAKIARVGTQVVLKNVKFKLR